MVTGHRTLTASLFGSDSLDFSHEPGLDTGAGLGFPERLRASGPRHTWEYVQAQGKAQEVPRLGISSVGPTSPESGLEG